MTASQTKKPKSRSLKTVSGKASRAASKISQTAKRTTKRASEATKKAVSRARQSAKSRKASQPKKTKLTWREGTLFSILGICALMIGISIFISAFYNPEAHASKELEKLAKSYYIEYLYPQVLGKNLNNPEKVLSKYAETGIASISLRQFLLYNNGKHYSSLSVFQNKTYQCNLNKTFVRYYPVAPYGPRDFRAQYYSACEPVTE